MIQQDINKAKRDLKARLLRWAKSHKIASPRELTIFALNVLFEMELEDVEVLFATPEDWVVWGEGFEQLMIKGGAGARRVAEKKAKE